LRVWSAKSSETGEIKSETLNKFKPAFSQSRFALDKAQKRTTDCALFFLYLFTNNGVMIDFRVV